MFHFNPKNINNKSQIPLRLIHIVNLDVSFLEEKNCASPFKVYALTYKCQKVIFSNTYSRVIHKKNLESLMNKRKSVKQNLEIFQYFSKRFFGSVKKISLVTTNKFLCCSDDGLDERDGEERSMEPLEPEETMELSNQTVSPQVSTLNF